MKTYLFVVTLLAGLILPSISKAADENMQLRYDVHWSGIRVGVLNLVIKEDKGNYQYIANMDALNIAKRVSKYWSTSIAQGKFSGTEYIPSGYTTRWRFKKEQREFNLHYDKKGKLLGETITPEDKRNKYAKVPVELKKDALDPLASGVMARKKIIEIAQSGYFPQSFKNEVFDGRRRFDVNLTVLGPQTLNLKGEQVDVIHARFDRTAIMGFSKGEMEDIKETNPTIDLYLDRKTYVPVWVTAKNGLGSATFTLAENKAE